MTKIIDGRKASAALIEKLAKEVKTMARPPYLVVLQVGDNLASAAYIRQKQKAAMKCGIRFDLKQISKQSSLAEIRAEVQSLNEDPLVDAFIVQLPLESSTPVAKKEEEGVLELIAPEKDADGLHTVNQGKLFCNQSEIKMRSWDFPISATALGILRLLEHYEVELVGTTVTLIGKSRLVGMPTATLLSHAGATVKICHRLTKNTAEEAKSSDVVIVAAGKMHLVNESYVTENSTVVDVGIHRTEDGRLTGDVCPSVYKSVAAYSPVPGGVGPMTVAALMENSVLLARQRRSEITP